MIAPATRRGDMATETIRAPSSAPGSSSVANWLSSRRGRHEVVLASAQALSDQPLARPSGRPAARRSARRRCGPGRLRFSAEQETMPCSPAAQRSSIHCAIASSQGQRSSSVSGMPRLILSTLAGGWKLSASRNGQPSAARQRRARGALAAARDAHQHDHQRRLHGHGSLLPPRKRSRPDWASCRLGRMLSERHVAGCMDRDAHYEAPDAGLVWLWAALLAAMVPDRVRPRNMARASSICS